MGSTGLRIVLVEDDRLLRKAAETALKRNGFQVFTVADGEEALRVTRAELPDLVVLDLILPKLQGFEVLRTLRDDPTTSSIPVIVVSSLGQEQDRQEALRLGASAYFNKADLPLGELVKRVRETLSGGR